MRRNERSEPRDAIEPFGALPEPEEHLLHHLFGGAAVPEHALGEPEHRAGVPSIRLGERLRDVARDRDDEPDVVGIGERDSFRHTIVSSLPRRRMTPEASKRRGAP